MKNKILVGVILLFTVLFLSSCLPGYKINPDSERIQDALVKEEIIEIHTIDKNDTIIQLYKPVPTRVVVVGNRNTVEIEEATDLRFVDISGADNVVYIPEEKKDSVLVRDTGYETTIVYY